MSAREYMENSMAAPCFKWPGGKRGVVKIIDGMNLFPDEIGTYYEPFFGAGAIYFYLYNKGIIKNAVISDINSELCNTYIQIRTNLEKMLDYASDINLDNKPDVYYKNRDRFNELKQQSKSSSDDLIERAILMLYLNKTAYSGMYRENRAGYFNVPYGNYKNPQIIDENNLILISAALKHTTIVHGDYIEVLSRFHPDSKDFVYFDPPYMKCDGISNFNKYNKNVFDQNEQVRLSRFYQYLSSINVRCMLSNSSSEMIRELYSGISGININKIKAPRLISRKYNYPNFVDEYLITNYNL